MSRQALAFTIFLLILTFLWNYFGPDGYSTPLSYFILIYFYLSTTLVHRFLIRTNERSSRDFVRAYMGSTAIRLFVNLIVILLGILLDKPHAMVFTLTFLFFYFSFLIFEIISLQKDLKGK